ncbi:iron-containing alcohol dehydrogenase family protein [Pantoea anthophila]|uniref:Iron-containing alcohol dehydrogenase family protein n=1 Tax=Pantoea anthophila TaxID=470931 RepID=A0ABY2Z3S4_9GAMM|nr:iron-containing alcohol dehydrogenase family protein [Pantoea anthophila]TPV21103.1 iron-containing alcohol dehydrogenase family protein [Pantoea anthophila]WIM56494.1 iron-containing alcohol dehydrogenase family protein [Pantoea anthophila]
MLAIISPRAYLHEAGLRNRVGQLIKPFATQIHILTSPHAWQAVNPELSQSLEAEGIRFQLNYLPGECTEQAIASVKQAIEQQGAELLLAIGGGRVLDAAKAAASQLPGLTLINFATQAATCAAWSPVAIIYNEAGGHLRSQPLAKMPEQVLVDSEVIARSDVRYLKAGIVDALAKYYEFRPYQQHNPDDLALDLKMMSARQALDIFLQQGDAALAHCQQQRVAPELVKVIDATIVLAGLSNSVRDDLPTPGFAHAIHNRLTHQPELHHWLHGEKVGFSLLVQSLMENEGEADAELLALLRHYDMPLRLPALAGDRQTALRTLAQQVTFPVASAERLPFNVSACALEQALRATDTLF